MFLLTMLVCVFQKIQSLKLDNTTVKLQIWDVSGYSFVALGCVWLTSYGRVYVFLCFSYLLSPNVDCRSGALSHHHVEVRVVVLLQN